MEKAVKKINKVENELKHNFKDESGLRRERLIKKPLIKL